MALWQYDLYLIPRARVDMCFDDRPQEVTAAQVKQLQWNGVHRPPDDYADRFASFLKPAPSWNPDVAVWGEALGNRIDVTVQEGQGTTIFARLDARDASMSPFVIGLVAFAMNCDALFLTDQGHLVPASVRELLTGLRQSAARRFAVQHPGLIDQVIAAERAATDGPAAAA